MNISSKLVISSLVVVIISFDAQRALAAPVDAKAARGLISDRNWEMKQVKGAGGYWSWKSDGTACLRLFEKKGKCDDTGRWTLKDNRMCYELGWWGQGFGMNSACYRIDDLGSGRYGALQDNGLNLFEFKVSK